MHLRGRTALILLALAAFGVLITAACSGKPDPAAIQQKLFDAINRGDTAAAVALFADDGVITGTLGCSEKPCQGKDAIQKEFQSSITAKTRVTRGAPKVTGNQVSSRDELANDPIKGAGVERVIVTHTVKLKDDKIASLKVELDSTDQQTAAFVAAVTPANFNVAVGAEEKLAALDMMTFLPSNLTVNVGDSIVFPKKTAEPHTVTFNVPDPPPADFIPQADGRLEANPQLFFPFPPPPPAGPPPAGPPPPLNLSVSFDGTGYLNSGFMQTENDVFKVTFAKAGEYPYVCLLHGIGPNGHMKGTITVNPAGTARAKSAANYDKDGADHLAVHKTNADALKKTITASIPPPAAAADGSRTFVSFAAAADGGKGNEFLQFFGAVNLTIKAGDRVTWKLEKNAPGVPHTITFLSGATAPDFIVVEPQPQGPPRLFLNPQVLPPSPLPSAPYAGTGFYNSGFLLAGFPPGAPVPPGFPATPQEFTLTFAKAGTYKYLCLVHDATGMNGTITVQN